MFMFLCFLSDVVCWPSIGPQDTNFIVLVIGNGGNSITMEARPIGEAAHLGQSPTIEDSKVQDFIELIQMGLQGTAPAHHTLAHPKCPSDLAVHKLLCKPTEQRLFMASSMTKLTCRMDQAHSLQAYKAKNAESACMMQKLACCIGQTPGWC
jgi:hypothetical protein